MTKTILRGLEVGRILLQKKFALICPLNLSSDKNLLFQCTSLLLLTIFISDNWNMTHNKVFAAQ